MPQRIICKECGYVLYEGLELKTPDEILQLHNERCPKCGKKLSLTPVMVEISRYDIKNPDKKVKNMHGLILKV